MDEAYWRAFIDVKIAEEYFYLYGTHARNCIIAINMFCLAVSCTGIAAWLNNLNPWLSSTIVLAAQLVSVFQTFYPYGERRYASKLIHDEYKQLAMTAEQTFNNYLYGTLEVSDFFAEWSSLKTASANIEIKYCSPDIFIPNNRLHHIAEQKVQKYLKTNFNVE